MSGKFIECERCGYKNSPTYSLLLKPGEAAYPDKCLRCNHKLGTECEVDNEYETVLINGRHVKRKKTK